MSQSIHDQNLHYGKNTTSKIHSGFTPAILTLQAQFFPSNIDCLMVKV